MSRFYDYPVHHFHFAYLSLRLMMFTMIMKILVMFMTTILETKNSVRQLLSIKENICAERHRKSYALQDAKE